MVFYSLFFIPLLPQHWKIASWISSICRLLLLKKPFFPQDSRAIKNKFKWWWWQFGHYFSFFYCKPNNKLQIPVLFFLCDPSLFHIRAFFLFYFFFSLVENCDYVKWDRNDKRMFYIKNCDTGQHSIWFLFIEKSNIPNTPVKC